MDNLVYVLNKNGNPLMPCKPSKARKLLRDKKAKVKKLFPFTIQLLWDCEEYTQPITLGIDKGAKVTGLCAVSQGRILFQADLHHRCDIKDKMNSRRAHRRSRRNRKWYRKPRFLNRKSYRPLPSIKVNADEVVRVVERLPLPFTKVIVEDVLIDVARLNTPDLAGTDYQKSNRLDENLRLACLMRDSFKCYQCKSNKVLNAHHIVPRSQGGKDTITNLITLCETCHGKVHAGTLALKLTGASGFKDQMAQQTMQGKNYLYRRLNNPEKVFGYQTSEHRKQLGLPKTHTVDAFCIAQGKHYTADNSYRVTFRPRQTRRQYLDLPQKCKGRVRYQVNNNLGGFRKGDVVKVKGYTKQVESIYSNGRLAFHRVKGEISSALPKSCKLVAKRSSMLLHRTP